MNARNDVTLHRASCETLEAMVVSAYPKFFFEELSEAHEWLNAEYRSTGWLWCGLCRTPIIVVE